MLRTVDIALTYSNPGLVEMVDQRLHSTAVLDLVPETLGRSDLLNSVPGCLVELQQRGNSSN